MIKVVRPRDRVSDRGVGIVDFDEEQDAREWAVYAIRNQGWRATCEAGETRTRNSVETVVAIASPDGRVGVWFGRAEIIADARKCGRSHATVTKLDAALTALDGEPEGRAAARYWDAKSTRGGDRDVSALAWAALRILHARAFGDPVAFRDTLLAPFALLTGSRPPTAHLLRASEDELLAASALLDIRNYDGARALLARKGVAA